MGKDTVKVKLEDAARAYLKTLDGKTREPDFIYNHEKYYKMNRSELEGLVFRLDVKSGSMVVEEDPRNTALPDNKF